MGFIILANMKKMIFDKEIIYKFYSMIKTDKNHRYKSWEHCYQQFINDHDVDRLSLNLAFYLASWGMYRGSSGLLQKDYKIHHGAVEILLDSKYSLLKACDMDITRKEIPLIIELFKELSNYYNNIQFVRNGKEFRITPTDTLITKIMLGSLGCVPAYDRLFNQGLSNFGITQKMGMKSLNQLFNFIENDNNKEIILATQSELTTEKLVYPKMKIIDMFFWSVGFEESQIGS